MTRRDAPGAMPSPRPRGRPTRCCALPSASDLRQIPGPLYAPALAPWRCHRGVRSMSPNRWLPALLVGAAIATPASADPQTFDQTLALASANAPSLPAAALKVESAGAALPAAGALPDPQLKVGLENVPISGPMAGRFGADEMTMATFGLMQEVPNGARRRAEAGIARADIGSAQAEVAVEALDVRLGAALAWI